MQRQLVVTLLVLLLASCGTENDPIQHRYSGDPNGQNYYGDSNGGGDSPSMGDTYNPPGDTYNPPGDTAGAPEINPGWFGGACQSASDCDDPYISGAMCETTGFPGGFCTQVCSANYTCPDTTYSGTLSTMSRCIDANGAPRCASECDYNKSPTGCRPGYACVTRSRYGSPSATYPICLPADTGRWPGEPVPGFDIGNACINDPDCESSVCMDLQGGYCSKAGCNTAGCPSGSRCFTFGQAPNQSSLCLKNCSTNGDCRTQENYICDSDNTCWPGPTPSWNSSVGTTDCSTWWGSLSTCDLTPDDYIVINKSARNVALCNAGSNVANFHGALGYSALGDKEQEGDGKTPEGVFYIPRLVEPSQYYNAFLLSYPDSADAARGITDGLISTSEQSTINAAQASCSVPPQYTELGGLIEIHGMSQTGANDWTWGCIAIENGQIDQLWNAVGVGDTIVVVP